jgi:hypothetical protein
MDDYLADFERMAQKYSLRKIAEAFERLRIKPGQAFFPRPDEVADEIEVRRESDVYDANTSQAKKYLAELERERIRLANDPAEIAWRIERFGYDPYQRSV